MDRLKELKEAKVAAQEVIARIDNAISSLNSASSCGIADLLGGGAFSSFLKRGKIKDANSDIKEISRSLNLLNKELEDVNMHLPTEVSDTISDNVFDVCFDNIYTDFKVQEEIKEGLNGLKYFRTYVVEMIEKLNYEIETFK